MIGAYITSTLTSGQVDPKQNTGLVIKYIAGKDDVLRINTRSLTANVSRENADVAAEAARPSSAQDQTSADINSGDKKDGENAPSPSISGERVDRILAFKALSVDATLKPARLPSPLRKSADSDEERIVLSICNEIERACKVVNPKLNQNKSHLIEAEQADSNNSGGGDGNTSTGDAGEAFIEKKDVVSLADAKKSTGLLEQVGYSIRRWVWA